MGKSLMKKVYLFNSKRGDNSFYVSALSDKEAINFIKKKNKKFNPIDFEIYEKQNLKERFNYGSC